MTSSGQYTLHALSGGRMVLRGVRFGNTSGGKMKQLYLGLVTGVFLTGCTSTAVISKLDEDQVIVEATHPNQAQVREEANRGCAFHGRAAVPVSDRCLDESCNTKSFLFACEGRAGYSGTRSSPWLGMSVDDIADHRYADPPGSAEVVVSRVYADGPAKKAGLRVGDIIETFNGVNVRSSMTLVDLKNGIEAGDRIPLGIRRGNNALRLVVTAAKWL